MWLRKDYKKNNCETNNNCDNINKCFCYSYFLGATGPTGPSSFNLTQIGAYQVLFQVGVNEAGQLILTLNGADLAYTVVGRATGTSQIIGMTIVETTYVNSILTVRNPAGNAAELTITPLAGGTRPVSAHLVITQIQ